MVDGIGRTARSGCATESGAPPPFFWKCVKRKGFKSFVLKVCETKGLADAFLRKCVKQKSLGAMWGLLSICDRSFGSLRSLRTTILVGWSFWPRLRFLGPFFGPWAVSLPRALAWLPSGQPEATSLAAIPS